MPNKVPSSVTRYTYAQLEALWIQAGGDRASAPIMAAIALAESSGDPTATNHNSDGSVDRGLWQINSSHGSLSTYNVADNAKAAVKIKGTQGLSAWVTYTNGMYRKFMKNGVNPDSNGLPNGSTSTADQAGLSGDIGTAIGQGLGQAFQSLMQPVISTIIWGGEVMFGIGIIGLGIVVFALGTDRAKQTAGQVGSLAGTAASAAAPELSPELQAAVRLRNARGRREAVRGYARKTARNSPRGQQLAAQEREKRIQREQVSQQERKAVRKEAARRNKNNGNGSTGNR